MTASEPAATISNASPPQRRPAPFSLSDPIADAMAGRGVYYGWIVAGATFLVMLATAGAMGAPGVIIQPLEHEFGWSTAEISVAFSVRLALFGLIAPFAAAFINRFGVRAVVVAAVLMIASGHARLDGDDRGVATARPVGRRGRHRHRHGGAGARRDGRVALVRSAARSGGGHADGEQRDRATDLSAAASRS